MVMTDENEERVEFLTNELPDMKIIFSVNKNSLTDSLTIEREKCCWSVDSCEVSKSEMFEKAINHIHNGDCQ
jgi:hypothetical protein